MAQSLLDRHASEPSYVTVSLAPACSAA
jgi:hypothetical protein